MSRSVAPRRSQRGPRWPAVCPAIGRPEKGWKIADVVRLEMADGNQRQIVQASVGLSEAKECAAACVNENLPLTADPDEVTG